MDHYLRQHPEIGMADVKELHFFSDDRFFRNNNPSYSLYHSHFAHVRARKIWGEATPEYMFRENFPRRTREYNPDMKLIMVLRNPIDRAYSHWNMEREKQFEKLSFWDAIHRPSQCGVELSHDQHRRLAYTYINRGFYTEQLERIWNYFPRNQTLIFKSEDLRKNPLPVLNQVCRFLEAGPFGRVENKVVHSRPYPSPMSEREREFLKQVFIPEIRQLEQLLGWDCSDWLAS